MEPAAARLACLDEEARPEIAIQAQVGVPDQLFE